jgi:hypothetical protein
MELRRSLQQPHNGEVLRKADDFFGHAGIMAAQVAAKAHGNGILVSSLEAPSTRSAGTFEFGEPRTAELKRIPSEHQLFPLVWGDSVL